MNAITVLHVNSKNKFSIKKINLATGNLHRHQGLHLLDHQLKMTPLQYWRFHLGVYK